MQWRARGCLLWSRALMAGALSFTLGALGHLAADGLLPGPGTLAVLAALSIVLAAAALARPASYLRLVGLVMGLQTLTHLFLSITAGHRGDPVAAARPTGFIGGAQLPTSDGRRVGSLLDAYAAQVGQQPVSPTLPVGHLLNDISAHLPMLVAHTIASILIGLWLGVGERALWALLTLLGHRLLPLVHLALQVRPTPRLGRPAFDHREPSRRARLLLRADPRRGPPLLSA